MLDPDQFFDEQQKRNIQQPIHHQDSLPIITAIMTLGNRLLQSVLSVRVQNLPEIQAVKITNPGDLKSDNSNLVQAIENIRPQPFPKIQKVEIINPEDLKPDHSGFSKLAQVIKEGFSKKEPVTLNLPDNLEVTVKNPTTIPSFPKFPSKFEVTNFPKQEPINLGSLEGLLKAINDSLYELRLSVEQGAKTAGSSTNIVATPMGSHKEQLPGIVLYDSSENSPTYVGMNQDPSADESASTWTIVKHTYSGNYVTRSVTRKGSWTNRATLF